MRFRTPTIKVPVSEIETSSQSSLHEAAAHRRRVSYTLGRIVRKVVDYPACPQSVITIEDFRLQQISSRHSALAVPIRVANMKDGVGLVFISEEFLEDRVHKLILPKTGDPEYSRWAINVDCQKIPSAGIKATGVEQIAANPELYSALNFGMGALAVEAANGWVNRYK